ncbi:MAG: HAD family hydrolase, partial [Candidatus Bathyarchaeia archaeon]
LASLKQFNFYSPSFFDPGDGVLNMSMKVSKILKKDVLHKIKNKFQKILEKYELKGAKVTKPLPGVVEAIKKLKSMNLKLAIFTANGKKPVEIVLKKFDLRKYFEVCVARDDVFDLEFIKPNTQHLKIVLNFLNIKPYEVIVIGDGRGDITCARSVGAIAVGVLTGISKFDDLKNAGADYIIPSLKALPKIISELEYVLEDSRNFDRKSWHTL